MAMGVESVPGGAELNVCVVGSGISGMSAAHYLTDRPGVSVTVLEAGQYHGGRANVTEDGEHCTRLFLADYHYLLGLFREIPAGAGSVLDSLRRCGRYAGRRDGTWVEIDHIYAFFAKTAGLSARDKWAIAKGNWQAVLVARRSVQSANMFASIWNWSPGSLARAMASSRRERVTYALPGSTDSFLTAPWLEFLRSRGVEFQLNSRVEAVSVDRGGVVVTVGGRRRRFDAVAFTGFAPDAYGLLDRSGIPRPLDRRAHTHCKALTIDLDPREEVLTSPIPRIYAGAGITTVVQPHERRCVTLAAFPRSTETDFLLTQVHGQLGLRHPVAKVRVRDNLLPGEAVFVGEYVDPSRLEAPLRGRVYFAGSYTDNSYPLDSAEGACRSAFLAVRRLAADHPRLVVRSALGLPPAAGRPATTAPHPNSPPHPRLDRLLRAAATTAAAIAAPLVADVVFDDRDGPPLAEPAVYVANHRSVFDVPAGVLAFRHLRVSPRLVVADKYFTGPFGKLLRAIGALPAVRGSEATITAGIAAVRAGESVAIMPEGRITDAEAAVGFGRGAAMIAIATGAPVVPIGARGTDRVWRGNRPWPLIRWRRPQVTISVGEPIDPAGRTWQELTELMRAELRRLEHGATARESAERGQVAA